ncbi:hypothetical protein EVAR_35341_1 [Eumeta japonica]|uniref:Secreted protein n=1 Tax=Eumeta variegata TaxID=151549 RepID=A0A4C1XHM2_EUMVA|nr:hypothetical protein EVAR_35341_1 [Eumeta japonica]
MGLLFVVQLLHLMRAGPYAVDSTSNETCRLRTRPRFFKNNGARAAGAGAGGLDTGREIKFQRGRPRKCSGVNDHSANEEAAGGGAGAGCAHCTFVLSIGISIATGGASGCAPSERPRGERHFRRRRHSPSRR